MEADYTSQSPPGAPPTQKRLEFIKERTRARVWEKDDAYVMTVPHLVVREIIAFEVMVVVLAIISLLVNAPLEWVADPIHTPNPAKAPWYFLGLQELLHYFPPVVAGVILPTLVVIALILIPYVPVNLKQEGMWVKDPKRTVSIVLPVVLGVCVVLFAFHVYAMLVPSLLLTGLMLVPYFVHRPRGVVAWLATRPVQWWVMTWFVTIVVVLTAIGTLFRGPEWSWTWPWKEIY